MNKQSIELCNTRYIMQFNNVLKLKKPLRNKSYKLNVRYFYIEANTILLIESLCYAAIVHFAPRGRILD